MATTEFIAAIELGSSKITGVAGRKNSDGSMQILAYAQEDSSTFIRKGVIFNLDKTAQSLTSIINRLEGELKNSIAKVYVGIGGQSLRTVRNVVSRDLEEEAIISEELVSAIGDENIAIPVVDMDILDVAPQEYKVGNNLQANPVGLVGSHIEGRFLNIVARASVRKNLEHCFQQAKIDCPARDSQRGIDRKRTPFGLRFGRLRCRYDYHLRLQKQYPPLPDCAATRR